MTNIDLRMDYVLKMTRFKSLGIRLSVGAMLAGTACAQPVAFGQEPRSIVRSEFFTARLVEVEPVDDTASWVTVEFIAGPISQAEAIHIRFEEGGCARPATMTGAGGMTFISDYCAGDAPFARNVGFWLDEPEMVVSRRHRFAGSGPIGDGPFNIVIPIVYFVSGAEDRKAPETSQRLSFTGIR